MKIQQSEWTSANGWSETTPIANFKPNFVLVFGGIDEVGLPERYQEIKDKYPSADIVMNSTAGEIIDERVVDGSLICNAIQYEKTELEFVEISVSDHENSYACAKEICDQLSHEGLKHVLIVSDGSMVNGDELVKGMNSNLDDGVLVTGGLAADAGRFSKTLVGLNAAPSEGNIVAIGHYGENIEINHGSKGGWDEFGPVRSITKSEGNVLFELDGQNALEVYKKYLGPKASELPGAALLFPLCIYFEDGSKLVRTILSIDEDAGSMTFAGDIPSGLTCRFMMANFDRLIDGAASAAETSLFNKELKGEALVLMISCVGRKLVLGQRVEEEVESVKEIFGDGYTYTGFYSNGEISPVLDSVGCSLHNQTMTITTYNEN